MQHVLSVSVLVALAAGCTGTITPSWNENFGDVPTRQVKVREPGGAVVYGEVVEVAEDPTIGLIEGDIVVDLTPSEGGDGLASTFVPTEALRWEGGIVPFAFADDYPYEDQVGRAFDRIESRVDGVRFVERTTEEDYVEFRVAGARNTGSSRLGRIGGRQWLNLGPGMANSTAAVGLVMHELLHALGVHHEHTRADRDEFVEIQWANIEEGREGNFRINPGAATEGAYDFDSVMHYSSGSFSSGGATILRLPDRAWINSTQSSARLSDLDVQGLERMYPAGNERPTTPTGTMVSVYGPTNFEVTWERSSDPDGHVVGYRVFYAGAARRVEGPSFYFDGERVSRTEPLSIQAVDDEGALSAQRIIFIPHFEEPDPVEPTEHVEPVEPVEPTLAAPVNVRASVYSQSALEVFWTAPADENVVAYEIRQDGRVIDERRDGRSLFIEGLTAGTEYLFRVASLDAAGNASDGREVRVTTNP